MLNRWDCYFSGVRNYEEVVKCELQTQSPKFQVANLEQRGLVMLDAIGRQIISVDLLPAYSKVTIDISGLPYGLYIYRAYTNNRNLSEGKLVIEK